MLKGSKMLIGAGVGWTVGYVKFVSLKSNWWESTSWDSRLDKLGFELLWSSASFVRFTVLVSNSHGRIMLRRS